MKKVFDLPRFGKNNLSNGLIALMFLGAIVLGCTGNSGKNSSGSKSDANAAANGPAVAESSPAAKKTSDASKGELPEKEELQSMVKATLLKFNDAVQKKDFVEFHGTISKTWQEQITPDKLKEAFNAFIEQKVDIRGIGSLDSVFSQDPRVNTEKGNKILELVGVYPTRPRTTAFKLKYLPEGKDWKLIEINVSTDGTAF